MTTPSHELAPRELLGALQLADSALPIGRFVHSFGLEAWRQSRPEADADEVRRWVRACILGGVARLDAVAVAFAHRAEEVHELAELDAWLHARKLARPARDASVSCGRRLATLGTALAPGNALLSTFATRVARQESPGHLAVVAGALCRAQNLAEGDAVVLELSTAAAGLLSAAVRLGAMSPTQAQVALRELHPALALAAADAQGCALADATSATPEMEVFVLAHRTATGRSFAT